MLRLNQKKKLYGILICGFLLLVICCTAYSKRTAVVTYEFDGYKITKNELAFHMDRMRGEVRNYFKNTCGVSLSADDWQKSYGGEIPEEKLKDLALNTCKKDKLLFILGKEYGLTDYVDFDDFLSSMEKENEQRKETVAEGGIVYGLVEYGREEYYTHVISNLKIRLRDILSKKQEEPLYTTEEEVYTYFINHKEEWAENATEYRVMEYFLPDREDPDVSIGKSFTDQLYKGDGFEEVCKQFETAGTVKEHTFNGDSYAKDVRSCYEIRMAAEILEEGEISGWITVPEGKSIIKLSGKKTDEEKSYQEYKERIRQNLTEEKFVDYMERLYRQKLAVKDKNY